MPTQLVLQPTEFVERGGRAADLRRRHHPAQRGHPERRHLSERARQQG
ncbi:hypothetical protein AB0K51_23700 [Kitasatospora sp. NPDC049285]